MRQSIPNGPYGEQGKRINLNKFAFSFVISYTIDFENEKNYLSLSEP